MTQILKVSGVAKTYQEGRRQIAALAEIDLAIQNGEFVCLIGPNGCGKSTLLKIIASIQNSSSGNINLNTKQAYLPQQSSLLPWLNIEDNLLLPGKINPSYSKISQRQVSKLLKEFDLLDFAKLYPSALSGGMQQKAALLRTSLFRPGLLLLDEPFSMLDAITRLHMQQWLLDLWAKTKPGVLCVTHDIREAVFLADTIYVLSGRPGRIKRRFSVDLPRPRRQQHLASSSAQKLEKALHKLLVNPL